MKIGVVIGNRGFFADELCLDGRRRLLQALEGACMTAVILPEEAGVYGSVQSQQDACRCAELFKQHRADLQGIILSLPNFGDEKAIARVLREAKLDVPILVHAFPDAVDKLDYENRRDSFCGKISVCNNLRQLGIPFSLTRSHTVDPASDEFRHELAVFQGVCRIVTAVRGARIGVIGPRPADFNTVRYSEKLLERHGVSVEPIGLVDILQQVDALADDHADVGRSAAELERMDTSRVPAAALHKMAKLLTVFRTWVRSEELNAVAVQCWDSLQRAYGINPCAAMSLLSNAHIPASCESDVMGALSMLILQAASGKPSALVDWNNNYGAEEDGVVLFHCGNFAGSLYDRTRCAPAICYPPILASSLGQANTYGSVDGSIQPGPVTLARISTDDTQGIIRAYCAEGEMTDERLETFGSWGVAQVPDLQRLMQYICLHGFEHHVAINLSATAAVLEEALGTYLQWDVYSHGRG